jgi:hypothetical protein
MKRNHPRFWTLALLGPTALVATGCLAAFIVGAGLGVAGMKYVSGEGKTAFSAGVEDTRKATVWALEDLSLPVVDRGHDAFSARIASVTASGRDIKIELERQSSKVTMVSIRVGVWGDETITRQIFQHIEDRLKNPK